MNHRRYGKIKTYKSRRGDDVLDLRAYELNSVQDIVNIAFEVSEWYQLHDRFHIPDILLLNEQQLKLFPKSVYIMRGPYNMMELVGEDVYKKIDNPKEHKQ